MSSDMALPISADAAKKMVRMGNAYSLLSLVGTVTTEEVAVQIPTVADPDETVDGDWTALMQDGVAIKLDADNNVVWLPTVSLDVRLEKSAGVAGNAYGVRRC